MDTCGSVREGTYKTLEKAGDERGEENPGKRCLRSRRKQGDAGAGAGAGGAEGGRGRLVQS
jgi:hypothetical protein